MLGKSSTRQEVERRLAGWDDAIVPATVQIVDLRSRSAYPQ